jgi:hypothetical protein
MRRGHGALEPSEAQMTEMATSIAEGKRPHGGHGGPPPAPPAGDVSGGPAIDRYA